MRENVSSYNKARFSVFPAGKTPMVKVEAHTDSSTDTFSIIVENIGDGNTSHSWQEVSFVCHNEDLPVGHFIKAIAEAIEAFVKPLKTKEG
tara:strand:+ start:940 stop:1212 length:273 start_codon:yes stop_codon:yes gene_type:complete